MGKEQRILFKKKSQFVHIEVKRTKYSNCGYENALFSLSAWTVADSRRWLETNKAGHLAIVSSVTSQQADFSQDHLF